MHISTHGKRLFIARHGETVFNKARRMQGMTAHTPLTLLGCRQASAMGAVLRDYIVNPHSLALLASPSGRTLQTLALIAEEIYADWHTHMTDTRLREIDVGSWEGRSYAEVQAQAGDFVDSTHMLFTVQAPGGELYSDIEQRLKYWIADQSFDRDMVIVSHGMTARVLRALLLGLPPLAGYDAPIAPSLAQGSMVMIRDGLEEVIVQGDGTGERA